MPSLRKRVSSYFRQLSFHNEPRDKRHNINENTFVTKYLQGSICIREGPPIIYGKNPTDLPNYELKKYEYGPDTVIGCYSGPNGGLTTVKRTEKHLSVLDADIDFIDTQDEDVQQEQPKIPKKSPIRETGQPIDNTTMIIKMAGQEYCVTNKPKKSHSKSHSLGSISDFHIEIEKTKIDKDFYSTNTNNNCDSISNQNDSKENTNYNSNSSSNYCDKTKSNNESQNEKPIRKTSTSSQQSRRSSSTSRDQKVVMRKKSEKSGQTQRNSELVDKRNSRNYGLAKSKSEGNPFQHKKGKIIKVSRPNIRDDTVDASGSQCLVVEDRLLPQEWNKKSDFFYGVSDSLYDRNQVTKSKNGDPIADCFGIIARRDSAILAVADGVNWGEKASIAAKSAVHGCLHYLNKTIFHDTTPFDHLTVKTEESSAPSSISLDYGKHFINNTREIFVCLLRAFNCAHDLILENKGMLTTLTVAVVLPLKDKIVKRVTDEKTGLERREEYEFISCVCNVGDTLAYVYSQKYGVRELTKGSHDIYCNRDMRDALGALGPVDGINPELSNLTLSVTILQKGDIIMVASDGLTDNFDPNVCRFTVNSNNPDTGKSKRPSVTSTNTRPNYSQTRSQPKPLNRQIQSAPPHRSSQPHSSAFTAIESESKESSYPKQPPVKPPRRSKMKDDSSSRSSSERTSIKSTISDKSTSPVVDIDVKKEVEVKKDAPLETHFDNNFSKSDKTENVNPLVAQFLRENAIDDNRPERIQKTESLDNRKPLVTVAENRASSLRRQASSQKQENNSSRKSANKHVKHPPSETRTNPSTGTKFSRAKTALDFRSSTTKHILRNEDGIPYVTPIQRYELQLLLMEDILKNGISGRDGPCNNARKLCDNLVHYTLSITSAKRHTLEDPDLYFDNRNGVLVEVSQQEKKIRRKRGLEKVQNLPGKLDHVSVVAYNVGNVAV